MLEVPRTEALAPVLLEIQPRRLALGITREDLAQRAGVAVRTLEKVETRKADAVWSPLVCSVDRILAALSECERESEQ